MHPQKKDQPLMWVLLPIRWLPLSFVGALKQSEKENTMSITLLFVYEQRGDRDFNEGPLKLTQSDEFTKHGQLTAFL